ncbi:uncharacterized protein LOC128989761 isoform X2 [Macrosteles quadrilineatus]|uniref:uncharacterized protein LOC128989761 isoform X2 n=1 Tax=Macrosteles quadrilineatus TaxID=74068 RepID=UPI0023E11A0B|nr:uncharacterized protein LOC128989761 isoform X2 [Macrosteles quadrilineatus]
MSNSYKYQQTSVYGVCEEETSNYNDSKCLCFWDFLIPFTRFWGVFTSVVLCGVGVDITIHQHSLGIYLVAASFLVLLLEITWAITLFLQVCIRNEDHPVLRCWDVVLWCGLWKRSILYTAIAVVLFLRPHRLWLSLVAGVQLSMLAACYLLMSCRSQWYRRNSGRLLLSQTPSVEDRMEDVTEILDDSLPGPVTADNLSPLDQDSILDI